MPARALSLIKVLLIVLLGGIIGAIALSNYLDSKRAANRAAAIETIRLIHEIEISYASTIGKDNCMPSARVRDRI